MNMSLLSTTGSRLAALAARPVMEPKCLAGVRVYFASLDACAARELELLGLLNVEEQERAMRIGHRARRSAFIASRSLLREALSEYSGHAVGRYEWQFGTTMHGKLFVAAPTDVGLRFSVAYTANMLVIAVSQKFELGVDIEALPPEAEGEVPWHVLTAAERRQVHALPAGEQYLEFLRLWTLKEAYTKYFGLGASLDFRGVEIDLDGVEATAPAMERNARLDDPLLMQQLLTIDGRQVLFALAGGKVL